MLALHPWVYIYPLHAILSKFHKYCGYTNSGKLLAAILTAVAILNHPHPTWYEFCIVITLFIPHSELIFEVKSSFLTVIFYFIGSLLSAVMWKVWTNRLGGNSNFFYFQTIISNLSAVGFIIGFLYYLVEKTNKVRII